MCGFACSFDPNGFTTSKEEVKAALLSLKDRGPDSQGVFMHHFDGEISLAYDHDINNLSFHKPIICLMVFARLSIRDLTTYASQPFSRQEHVTVFNGEVYNDCSISSVLGIPYKHGQGDIETVHKCFQSPKAIEYFQKNAEGMYAICSYNIKTRTLIVARDSFGIKPLYINKQSHGRINFSSSIKALVAGFGVNLTVEQSKLCEYLLFRQNGYVNTIYENIQHLEPGLVIHVSPYDTHELLMYGTEHILDDSKSYPDYNSSFPETICRAVDLNSVADCPIAAAFSGGIDSTIVSLILHQLGNNAKLFSIDVSQQELSESLYMTHYQEAFNQQLCVTTFDASPSADVLSKLSMAMEEPISHPNSLGIYQLCESVNLSGIKVLLSGEGADEILMGYERMYWNYLTLKTNGLASRELLRNFSNLSHLSTYLGQSIFNPSCQLLASLMFMPLHKLQDFFSKSVITEILQKRFSVLNQSVATRGITQAIALNEMQNYLPSLLLRADKMGMANSVEVRVPFLTKDFVRAELCKKINKNIKLFSRRYIAGCTKIQPKRYVASKLGQGYAYRRKQGFTVPVDKILKSPYIRECVENSCVNDIYESICSPSVASRVVSDKINWPLASVALSEANLK